MTGYGRAVAENDKRQISVELRSINHRYLELTVKAPRAYSFLEDAAKKQIGSAVARGKVDVYISVKDKEDNSVTVDLNGPLVDGYIKAGKQAAERYGIPDDLTVSSVLRMPDALLINKDEPDVKEITSQMSEVLEGALCEFNKTRQEEGTRLCEDILYRAGLISDFVDFIDGRSPQTVDEYKEKLSARMTELLGDTEITEQRILAEAALYADKVSVTEEIIRLRSHLKQLESMIKGNVPYGRKLDFLVQEFNREANTIGSKACDLEITRKVVDMKAEIEK
ncbi:MAG: YicC family protein, partial [Clostridia bacterium]|nr:YicC family protein [Clostridia bacterium]